MRYAPPADTEFECINRMYSNGPHLKRACLLCSKPFNNNGEIAICSKCRPHIEDLENDLQEIDLDEYPGLKLSTAFAMLALRDTLPKLVKCQHWIPRHTLFDALEDSRHFRILQDNCAEQTIKMAFTREMKRQGWEINRCHHTYFNAAACNSEEGLR